MGEILLPSTYVSFRGHPRHVWTEDGRWKLGDYEEKQRKFELNGRTQGGMGEILLPSASVSFRGLSVDIGAMCGRKLPEGRWGIMKENKENSA